MRVFGGREGVPVYFNKLLFTIISEHLFKLASIIGSGIKG